MSTRRLTLTLTTVVLVAAGLVVGAGDQPTPVVRPVAVRHLTGLFPTPPMPPVAVTTQPATVANPPAPAAGTTTGQRPASTTTDPPAHEPPPASSVASRALAAAETKLGHPYVWGATGPNSFDCSGLVVWAYHQVGVTLPRTSAAQSSAGIPVPRADLQPGDLVFFYNPVTHVGIYLGNDLMLDASQPGVPIGRHRVSREPFHNARRILG